MARVVSPYIVNVFPEPVWPQANTVTRPWLKRLGIREAIEYLQSSSVVSASLKALSNSKEWSSIYFVIPSTFFFGQCTSIRGFAADTTSLWPESSSFFRSGLLRTHTQSLRSLAIQCLPSWCSFIRFCSNISSKSISPTVPPPCFSFWSFLSWFFQRLFSRFCLISKILARVLSFLL